MFCWKTANVTFDKNIVCVWNSTYFTLFSFIYFEFRLFFCSPQIVFPFLVLEDLNVKPETFRLEN